MAVCKKCSCSIGCAMDYCSKCELKDEWVDVDIPPTRDDTYLVTTQIGKNKEVVHAAFTVKDNSWSLGYLNPDPDDSIIAWREIPRPYSG